MKKDLLVRAVLILLLLVLFFGGLYFAASFLKPLAMAILVALLMLPVSRRTEKVGVNRTWSSLISVTIVVLMITMVLALLLYQAQQISTNADELEEKGKEKVEKLENTFKKKTGLTSEQIDTIIETTGFGKIENAAGNTGNGILNSLSDLFLMTIYTFLFLYYRQHLKRFVLKITGKQNRDQARKTMEESAEIALQYLNARFILMAMLAVVYSLGLLALGIKYAIFFGIFAALLSVIPYIGNIIGAGFPLLMAIIYQDTAAAVGVLVLFTITQLVESYWLEPVIVGKKVNLNPMMTILIAVLGGSVWGIVGMIIVIPYVAIMIIVFNKIDELKPLAYLLSNGNSH